jgi:hypothetical protein
MYVGNLGFQGSEGTAQFCFRKQRETRKTTGNPENNRKPGKQPETRKTTGNPENNRKPGKQPETRKTTGNPAILRKNRHKRAL